MNDNEHTVVFRGITFTGALQLIFVILKLCGVITWDWIFVLLPALIDLGCLAIIISVLFIMSIVNEIRLKKN